MRNHLGGVGSFLFELGSRIVFSVEKQKRKTVEVCRTSFFSVLSGAHEHQPCRVFQ